VPIIFKGSGFYVTDSRKGSTPVDEGKAKEASSKGGADNAAKKED
jgi:predicted nucleic acid-binding Zn ribbon protein